eukprot:13947932-Heterocapsa_arctica.AAC.1
MTLDVTNAGIIGQPIEIGTSGHKMIDLTQFDESISLPPKFFKSDVQDIGIVQDHAADKPSETRLPAQLPPTT